MRIRCYLPRIGVFCLAIFPRVSCGEDGRCCVSLSVGGIRGLQKECRGPPADKAEAVLGKGVVADQGVLDDGLHALDER